MRLFEVDPINTQKKILHTNLMLNLKLKEKA